MRNAVMAIAAILSLNAWNEPAFAQTSPNDERLLMGTAEQVDAMCQTISSVVCQRKSSPEQPDINDQRLDGRFGSDDPFKWFSVDEQGPMSLIQKTRQYHSALVITRHAPEDGSPPYMTAHTSVFRQVLFSSHKTGEIDDTIWSDVGKFIPTAPASSDDANRYLIEKRAASEFAATAARDLSRYRASPEFQATQAAQRIKRCALAEQSARDVIAHERRVRELTGTVNLAALHSAGDDIANCEDQIARDWRIYTSSGGTSASVPDLLQTLERGHVN